MITEAEPQFEAAVFDNGWLIVCTTKKRHGLKETRKRTCSITTHAQRTAIRKRMPQRRKHLMMLQLRSHHWRCTCPSDASRSWFIAEECGKSQDLCKTSDEGAFPRVHILTWDLVSPVAHRCEWNNQQLWSHRGARQHHRHFSQAFNVPTRHSLCRVFFLCWLQ